MTAVAVSIHALVVNHTLPTQLWMSTKLKGSHYFHWEHLCPIFFTLSLMSDTQTFIFQFEKRLETRWDQDLWNMSQEFKTETYRYVGCNLQSGASHSTKNTLSWGTCLCTVTLGSGLYTGFTNIYKYSNISMENNTVCHLHNNIH